MTVNEWKQRRRELGYTDEQLSEWSGVPIGTIQKIFSDETVNPGYQTLCALEGALIGLPIGAHTVMEPVAYSAEPLKQGQYTIEDYYALPDDQRVELIDGTFFVMEAPSTWHQLIAGEVYRQIANFILDRGGNCTPLISPVDVQLDCDEKTMVQPDVVVVCDKDKIIRRCVYGVPDFVLEVISPSTRRKDCTKKLSKYMEAGVREYWILDPYQKKLLVYYFEGGIYPQILGLDAPVPVGIYNGELVIDMKHILGWAENMEADGDED